MRTGFGAGGRANTSRSWIRVVEAVDTRDDLGDDRGIAGLRRQARADHLHGAADGRQRVLDFVRDHRRHFAEPGQRRRFTQPLLELGAARQIVKDPGEVLFAVDLELADREVQRKVLAVAALTGHGAADADDLAARRSAGDDRCSRRDATDAAPASAG